MAEDRCNQRLISLIFCRRGCKKGCGLFCLDDALSLTLHVSRKKKTRARASVSGPEPRTSWRDECGVIGPAVGAPRAVDAGVLTAGYPWKRRAVALSEARMRPEKADRGGRTSLGGERHRHRIGL